MAKWKPHTLATPIWHPLYARTSTITSRTPGGSPARRGLTTINVRRLSAIAFEKSYLTDYSFAQPSTQILTPSAVLVSPIGNRGRLNGPSSRSRHIFFFFNWLSNWWFTRIYQIFIFLPGTGAALHSSQKKKKIIKQTLWSERSFIYPTIFSTNKHFYISRIPN